VQGEGEGDHWRLSSGFLLLHEYTVFEDPKSVKSPLNIKYLVIKSMIK